MERARVVLIGGGFWGCSTLYHLAAPGLTDCLLIEQGEPAGQTTGQAAGMIAQLRNSACEGVYRSSSSLRASRV